MAMYLCDVGFSETETKPGISTLEPLNYWTTNPQLDNNPQQCTPTIGNPENNFTGPDTIDTTFKSDSLSPQINIFSGGDYQQVPEPQPLLDEKFFPLFHDHNHEIPPYYLTILSAFWYSHQHYVWSKKYKNKHNQLSLYHLIPSFLVNILYS